MVNITTRELTKELCSREGVSNLVIQPHSEITIKTEGSITKYTGPAIIVINQD